MKLDQKTANTLKYLDAVDQGLKMPNLPLELRLNSILRSQDYSKVEKFIKRFETGPNVYKPLNFKRDFQAKADMSLVVEKYTVKDTLMRVNIDGKSDYFSKSTLLDGKNSLSIKDQSYCRVNMHISGVDMFYSGSFDFGRGRDGLDSDNWHYHEILNKADPVRLYTCGN